MATKTITVTEDAYMALKSLKAPRESFSETIMRVSKRKPLSSFYGILSKEKGEKLEKNISDFRKKRGELYKKRLGLIVKGMKTK